MAKLAELTPQRLRRYINNIGVFLEDQYLLPETGKPIVLEQWQKDLILAPLFLDLDEEGHRKYDVALIGMPKKNGKSALGAGIGVDFMYCDEPNGEIYVAANDLEQASVIIYTKIRKSIRMNKVLAQGTKLFKDRLEVVSTGTICRCIAHQAESAAGFNPSLVLFDELWGFSDRKFYDELTTSPIRKQPLNVIVTYAGYQQDGLLWDLYKDGMEGETLIEVPDHEVYVKRGKNDPRMFMFWSHENLASWVSPRYLDAQKRRLPPNVYARFHENRWTSGETPFLTERDFDRCLIPGWGPRLAPIPEESNTYVVATDLGLTRDRTCRLVVHWNPKDQKVYLDSIRKWQGSQDDPVLIADVEKDLVTCAERYKARALVIDPWQMQATIQKLRGIYNVVPFNFSADMPELSETLVALMRYERMVLFDDPDLRREVRTIIAKQTNRGWRIDHKSGQKNDCVVALGMGAMHAAKLGALVPGIIF